MAVKQFYATGDFKYQTRMLRAGDPISLDAPNARLWTALGKISPTKPKAVKAPAVAGTDTYLPDEGKPVAVPKAKAAPKKKASARKKAS